MPISSYALATVGKIHLKSSWYSLQWGSYKNKTWMEVSSYPSEHAEC